MNLTFTMSPSTRTSLSSLQEEFKLMAKNEGGAGLNEGLINWDDVAQCVHFLLNEKKASSDEEFMNLLVEKLKDEL